MSKKKTADCSYNIGFVSTRFSGTDGVSLETRKWVEVLRRMGHRCYFFAGLCDWPADVSRVVPTAFYRHPEVKGRHDKFFGTHARSPEDTQWIHYNRELFRKEVESFVYNFSIDLLIPENCLAIPLHVPLALALTEFIAETGFPTIAHHHDFVWERKRFLVNSIQDYISMAFPPALPSIQHAVINSLQREQLASQRGISSTVVPNVMDFDAPDVVSDGYCSDLRDRLGLKDSELLILQPTRVIQRKGIEHAIELVNRLGLGARLVISHASGDEGDAYAKRVRDYAALLNVPVTFASSMIAEKRRTDEDGRKVYSLADIYHEADLVTYPSEYEGFGNGFLEGVYYRRPMVVQNYSVYSVDIRPKGFDMIEFDEYVTDQTIEKTQRVLTDKELCVSMCTKNFELAYKYFSYSSLELKLKGLIANAFGSAIHIPKSRYFSLGRFLSSSTDRG